MRNKYKKYKESHYIIINKENSFKIINKKLLKNISLGKKSYYINKINKFKLINDNNSFIYINKNNIYKNNIYKNNYNIILLFINNKIFFLLWNIIFIELIKPIFSTKSFNKNRKIEKV